MAFSFMGYRSTQ